MTKLLNQIKSNHFDYGEDILKYEEKIKANEQQHIRKSHKIKIHINFDLFYCI